MIIAGSGIWFTCISCSTVVPYCLAICQRLSPGSTQWYRPQIGITKACPGTSWVGAASSLAVISSSGVTP